MSPSSGYSAKKAALALRSARLGVREEDIEEWFTTASGPGGQNVNKVATAVTVRHAPSGTSVTVQDSRSQAVNRQLARVRLLDAIEERRRAEKRREPPPPRRSAGRTPRVRAG